MNKYMEAAYAEASKNINGSEGGPFGAVIVRDGEIIAAANNQVSLGVGLEKTRGLEQYEKQQVKCGFSWGSFLLGALFD